MKSRKQKKAELLERIKSGPNISINQYMINHSDDLNQDIQEMYKIWADTWVIPYLEELLKEDPK